MPSVECESVIWCPTLKCKRTWCSDETKAVVSWLGTGMV